ncbi:MAG: VacJ family lipoprotein [Alphaproteobacteria bacterium]|jgi:phospholipid-binding lipoprotein MlaA|nr:VacJ family lipoprotein [Alphaproteobacteria bacterium]MBT7744167.1 VacJ family lipoprotein [Alphaproteobacteria bacterium]
MTVIGQSAAGYEALERIFGVIDLFDVFAYSDQIKTGEKPVISDIDRRAIPASGSSRFGRILAVVAAASLAACASLPEDPEARAEAIALNDPGESINRSIFEFNRGVDTLFLRPVSEMYRATLPQTGQDMVRNFLNNLKTPVVLANDLLQGEGERAGETFGRFVFNTTVGVGGLFDVAGIEHHSEDFGQTLATWGAPEGPYMVLPLIGPSPVRDTVGLVADYYIDPVARYFNNVDRGHANWVRAGFRAIDTRSRNIETLDDIERSAIDYYATIRSLYRQRRNDEIMNGQSDGTVPMPEISLETEDDDLDEKYTLLKTE